MKLRLSIFILFFNLTYAQKTDIYIEKASNGMSLIVNEEKFIINGMNWDYFPIGTNFSYDLWSQPDSFIKKALHEEMSMLKEIGVNVIRQYSNIKPKWIKYIYENYGIYTMLNHSFGRYGLTIDDVWVSKTDYSKPEVRKVLLKEIVNMAKEYKNTPGLLLYLLGNENNYGLSWEGAETENIPINNKIPIEKVRALYSLFNEAAIAIKKIDKNHPIAFCNGDLLYLDIIKEECRDLDIFGTNIYRGASFGSAFQKIKDDLNMPILFTEFGSDAFNSQTKKEDQNSQAYYLKENWKEIYSNSAGLGKAENSIGGFTFQFSDGWWKHGQTIKLTTHDISASWSNGGYDFDYIKGKNNMNEEWFGICAKGETDSLGFYKLQPRAAYYTLKEIHQINPYDKRVTQQKIKTLFSKIKIQEAVKKAK